MKSRLRASTMAFASLFIFGCGALSAIGADLDTSRLPRVSGGKEIYASTASTIFTTPQTVSQTTAALSLSLAAQGWQRYIAPFTSYANDPNSTTLSFKKGPQGLSVYITVAPAQNNATSVQYGAIALQTDLPFPPDATDIEYSPTRPHLICKTAQPVGAALAFFGAELAAQGWSAWSTRDAAKIPPGSPIGDVTPKGGYAWFVQDGKPPPELHTLREKWLGAVWPAE